MADDLGKVGININLRHGKLAGLNKAEKKDRSELILVLGVHLRLLIQLPYQIFIGEIQIKEIETFLEIPK